VTTDTRPIGVLIGDLLRDVREIVRGEVRLASAELLADALALRRAAVFMAVAGMLVLMGVAYLFLSALFGLATVIPMWAAALLLGAGALLAAAGTAFAAMKGLKRVTGVPRTLAVLEETTRWPIQSKP